MRSAPYVFSPAIVAVSASKHNDANSALTIPCLKVNLHLFRYAHACDKILIEYFGRKYCFDGAAHTSPVRCEKSH